MRAAQNDRFSRQSRGKSDRIQPATCVGILDRLADRRFDLGVEPGQGDEPRPAGFDEFVEDDGLDLRHYWRVVLHYKWGILGLVFGVALFTLVWAFALQPVYRATATLMIGGNEIRSLAYGWTNFLFLCNVGVVIGSFGLWKGNRLWLSLSEEVQLDPAGAASDLDFVLSGNATLGTITQSPTLVSSRVLELTLGVGVDHIDVAEAYARGVYVTNTPGVLTEDTADMTMALILAGPRRLTEGAAVLTGEGEWQGWSPTWMLGRRISGKKLGIIGHMLDYLLQQMHRLARLTALQIGRPQQLDRRGMIGDLGYVPLQMVLRLIEIALLIEDSADQQLAGQVQA